MSETTNPTVSPPPPTRKNHGWIYFFVFIIVASVGVAGFMIWFNLSIQLKPEQLAEAQQLWKEKGPKSYNMVYTKRLNDDAKVDKFEVQVRAEKVTKVVMNGKALADDAKDVREELQKIILEQTKTRAVGLREFDAAVQKELAKKTEEVKYEKVEKSLTDAAEAMKRAARKLDAKLPADAAVEQDKAIEHLQAARLEIPGDPLVHHSMDRHFRDIERFMDLDQKPGAPKVYVTAIFDPETGALRRYIRRVMGSTLRIEMHIAIEAVPQP